MCVGGANEPRDWRGIFGPGAEPPLLSLSPGKTTILKSLASEEVTNITPTQVAAMDTARMTERGRGKRARERSKRKRTAPTQPTHTLKNVNSIVCQPASGLLRLMRSPLRRYQAPPCPEPSALFVLSLLSLPRLTAADFRGDGISRKPDGTKYHQGSFFFYSSSLDGPRIP